MHKYLKLLLCILAPLITGALAGMVTSSNIPNWYQNIQKPSFNPPNYLFAPVWTLLYLLMGIGLFLILQAKPGKDKSNALFIFGVQWILNFCWSFLFFKYHLLGLALIEIITMWLSIMTMIFLFAKVNKTAAYLQLPYLAWVSFASILNASIWYLNK